MYEREKKRGELSEKERDKEKKTDRQSKDGETGRHKDERSEGWSTGE